MEPANSPLAPPAPGGRPVLEHVEDYFVARFRAMASPCEVLLDTEDEALAGHLAVLAVAEAQRIERAFSRYRDDNIVHRLNTAGGAPVAVDGETAHLLDYAQTCYTMSGGLFDITSGVLRRAWTFDGGSRVPAPDSLRALLAYVGWEKVVWDSPVLTLRAGMEIDFGGIGKEYAVDRAAALMAADSPCPGLVNFGGDVVTLGPRRDGSAWRVGIDDPARTGEAALYRVDIERGGLATSGDARRFVMHQGRRLGHILDPRTGWPVANAPRAVTVLAATCVEAGTLATWALLQGAGADEFLRQQGVDYRIV